MQLFIEDKGLGNKKSPAEAGLIFFTTSGFIVSGTR